MGKKCVGRHIKNKERIRIGGKKQEGDRSEKVEEGRRGGKKKDPQVEGGRKGWEGGKETT